MNITALIPNSSIWRRALFMLIPLMVSLGVLGIVFGSAAIRLGSLARLQDFLAGKSHCVEPTHLNLGTGDAGESIAARVRIVNLGFQPLKIIGARPSCSCTVVDSIPLEIEPWKAATISVEIRRLKGPFSHSILFYTNYADNRRVVVTLDGRGN